MFKRRRIQKTKAPVSRKTWIKRSLIATAVLLVLGISLGLFWYLAHLPSLSVTSVVVEGGETVPGEIVKEVVEKELEGNYYRFIPKRFSWLYPEEAILAKVKTVPRVKDVSIERPNSRTVSIKFTEYSPYALWCEYREDGLIEKCLFMDTEGYAFAPAPMLKGSAFLRYIDKDHAPKVGEKTFEASFLRFGAEFTEGLGERFGYGVVYMERINTGDIIAHLSNGGTLKINNEQTAQATLDNLLAILSSKQFANLADGDFEYIDLRYGNKVFVKEKTFATQESATTTEIVEE